MIEISSVDKKHLWDLCLNFAHFSMEDNAILLHVAKSASTSILYRKLDSQGLDLERLLGLVEHPEITWEQGVWSLTDECTSLYRNLPREIQLAIQESENLKYFAITRNPIERIWSAWVSKIIVGEPPYLGFRDNFFRKFELKEIGSTTTYEDLSNYFKHFLIYLSDEPLLFSDIHFAPQSTILEPFLTKTTIVDITGFEKILKEKMPVFWSNELPVRNRTSALLRGPLLLEDSLEAIFKLYEKDFEQLGYDKRDLEKKNQNVDSPGMTLPSDSLLIEKIKSAKRLSTYVNRVKTLDIESRKGIEKNQELTNQLQALQSQNQELTIQLQALQSQNQELTIQLQALQSQNQEQETRLATIFNSVSWKITRPLRGLKRIILTRPRGN